MSKNREEFQMNVTEIRRPADMERITTPELAQAFMEEQVALSRWEIRRFFWLSLAE